MIEVTPLFQKFLAMLVSGLFMVYLPGILAKIFGETAREIIREIIRKIQF